MNLSTSKPVSFSCQCTTTPQGEKKGNTERCEYNSQTVAELCSQVPSRSLVFLGAWNRKEMVRNLHRQTRRILGPNGRGYDAEFLRFRSSNIFVPPVPLREENYEAREGERSPYTSTVVMRTSSCFSAR